MTKTKILLNINCFFPAKYSCFKMIRVSPVAIREGTGTDYVPGVSNSSRTAKPYRSFGKIAGGLGSTSDHIGGGTKEATR